MAEIWRRRLRDVLDAGAKGDNTETLAAWAESAIDAEIRLASAAASEVVEALREAEATLRRWVNNGYWPGDGQVDDLADSLRAALKEAESR